MAECDSHAIVDAALGPYSTGEQTLAEKILRSLKARDLVLADRGFFSYTLWRNAAATGSDLLWRMKSNAVLQVEKRYPDGSFASHIYPSTRARRNDVDGIAVRVVEYSITEQSSDTDANESDGTDNGLTCQLLTTILDPDAAPASDLAALYAQRWEIETAFDELTTHQRGPSVVLRSKLPDGVTQEVYGYLCVHYAIRSLMHTVATGSGRDPDRLSFTRSLRAARRTTASHPGFSPDALTDARDTVTAEILHELLPPRTHRANPRVVKRKMSV